MANPEIDEKHREAAEDIATDVIPGEGQTTEERQAELDEMNALCMAQHFPSRAGLLEDGRTVARSLRHYHAGQASKPCKRCGLDQDNMIHVAWNDPAGEPDELEYIAAARLLEGS